MWLRHRYTCPSASGLRIATHDNIARVWYAMLEAAGFQELAYEPRRWDAEAKSDERNTAGRISSLSTRAPSGVG